jgi:membrane protein DedA with SNARE-associated domain
MADLFIVFATAFLSGGFAIPTGFLAELPILATYLAACAGSVAGMVVFAFVGGGLRRWIMRRMKQPEDAEEKVAGLLGKWGVRGLGLVGPLFPGVTVSVLAGIAAGVDRTELIKWMTMGIFGLYAVYTLGLALLIEITGI